MTISPPVVHAAAALAIGLCGSASAQVDWRREAVPIYSGPQILQGLYRQWTEPKSASFAKEAKALVPALQSLCDAGAKPEPALRAARGHWRDTMLAWESLSAVSLGPVVERKSLRAIDFVPTRPNLIEKAIAGMESAAGAAPALDLIGTPAKGLPALEWLLWTKPAAPGSMACRYAVVLAREIEGESAALQARYRELAARDADAWDEASATAALAEFVNQWVGGVERLRWIRMEKPLRAKRPDELPRAASRLTSESWAAQWDALRSLTVFRAKTVPAPGEGLVPIEIWLRSQGRNDLADRLVAAERAADARMKNLKPADAARAQAAAKDLAALKLFVEGEAAPALKVTIGFSDADGD